MKSKLPALGLLVLFVLFGLARALAPSPPPPLPHGAGSVDSSGRLALRRLLELAHFPVERWDGRPGALPRQPGVLWLAQLPPRIQGINDAPQVADEPLREELARGLANPQHYRRFAAQGGTLLVEVDARAQLERLVDEFGMFELQHLELQDPGPAGDASAPPATWLWTSGETLQLAAQAAPLLRGLENLPGGVRLLEDGQGRTLVFEVPIGRGALVLVLVGSLFDNARLALHDHALLAVRLAERGSRGGTILLDESQGLGGGIPTLADLALSPRMLPVSLGCALIALLALWRSWRAREIVSEAAPPLSMSPRMRTLARARLFQRAQRFDLLAGPLRLGTLRRLGARAGIAADQAPGFDAAPEATRAWIARAVPGPDQEDWARLLSSAAPRTGPQFEHFERTLRRLELEAEHSRQAARGQGRAAPGAASMLSAIRAPQATVPQ